MESLATGLVSQFRTLVVDDHKAFLDHVCSALRKEPGVEIVGAAQDGLEAVARAGTLQPDLVILDIGLPGLNGLEVAHRIRTLVPNARIVFLTQEFSPDIVHEALDLGAWAYVVKRSAGRELPVAVHAVMNCKKFVSEGIDGRAHII